MTNTSASAAKEWTALFYELPVEAVRAGVSTDTAQEVLSADFSDKQYVQLETYTPRSDNAALDREYRERSEARLVARGTRLQLCVFSDTAVDLSAHPAATNLRLRDPGTRREMPTTRAQWLKIQTQNGFDCR
ncbi:hypothetical protein BKG82_26755 [Mycobacteroides chelonae]|uniref:Uncharacterized protein n=1 Tax=Mycobacteroides chelonae TaxID=1774 RepID=A0A1S1LCW6_MYCCH|nr:hypothetical protein [Mycobacteroides chelonae]OHU47258.1 hypothetical protein BKG82_26755 [Mycobacteroides chelonae]